MSRRCTRRASDLIGSHHLLSPSKSLWSRDGRYQTGNFLLLWSLTQTTWTSKGNSGTLALWKGEMDLCLRFLDQQYQHHLESNNVDSYPGGGRWGSSRVLPPTFLETPIPASLGAIHLKDAVGKHSRGFSRFCICNTHLRTQRTF